MFLQKEDYEEQCCPLKMNTDFTPVPMGRVIEKLDEYLSRRDYDGAQRHLKYWLAEADAGTDLGGRLSILNEQIGLYRKLAKEAEALEACSKALELSRQLYPEGSVTLGTTLVNAATAFKAFGNASEALPLYEEALEIYITLLDQNDGRLGGLFNNMALTLMDLGRLSEAESAFNRALEIMSLQDGGQAECAITYLNLADLAVMRSSEEESDKLVIDYLDKAESLLDNEKLPRDGYYAFVCEKCAPVFDHYGYFIAGKKFRKIAEEIYERS